MHTLSGKVMRLQHQRLDVQGLLMFRTNRTLVDGRQGVEVAARDQDIDFDSQ